MASKRAADDGDGRTDQLRKERKTRPGKSRSTPETSIRDDLTEEYVCPITMELPIDPVLCADGHCYERSAIEEHIRRNGQNGMVRSPLTNVEISAQLFPATLVRNTLSRLVEQGVLNGERVDAWKAATQQQKYDRIQFEGMKISAGKGSANAMEDLGSVYEKGLYGQQKDNAKSYHWFLRGGRAGNAGSMIRAAVCHVNGTGVKRNYVRGMCMAHEAAAMGSEHACSIIAMAHASGKWAMEKDEAEASYWYKRAVSCRIKDTPQECRDRGKAYMEAHSTNASAVGGLLDEPAEARLAD